MEKQRKVVAARSSSARVAASQCNRVKMARFHFPAKPGKPFVKKDRISSTKFGLKCDRLIVADTTAAFVAHFYDCVGSSDEEEQVCNKSYI